MPTIHKVVPIQELVTLPSFWQSPAGREAEFAVSLQSALDQMAGDGWEFVTTYGGVGSGYLIFRRNKPVT
jgi:hypothetical protein